MNTQITTQKTHQELYETNGLYKTLYDDDILRDIISNDLDNNEEQKTDMFFSHTYLDCFCNKQCDWDSLVTLDELVKKYDFSNMLICSMEGELIDYYDEYTDEEIEEVFNSQYILDMLHERMKVLYYDLFEDFMIYLQKEKQEYLSEMEDEDED